MVRTIIYGPVTSEDIEAAAFLADIEPTSFITDPWTCVPEDVEWMGVQVFKPEEKLGELAVHNLQARMTIYADAAIIKGENAHLSKWARLSKLKVYEIPMRATPGQRKRAGR